jgi:polysaccharide export outer membrane protein
MRVRHSILAVALCGACAAPVPMPSNRPEPLLEYRLAPPDVIRITVRPEPVMERELMVRPDGRISFDLIGDVQVEAKTVEEVRAEVTTLLSRYLVSPTVSITLVSSNSRRYYVFGEVNRPGAYPLVGRVTAVDALAQAAGNTRFAALNSARLVRGGPEQSVVFPLRFEDITHSADASTNFELRPGDVVYVPPSTAARIGYAISLIFFPLQQIIGIGTGAVQTVVLPGT